MTWPWSRSPTPPLETRQSGGAGFTAAVSAALFAQATGGTVRDASATAALEAAAGAYARAFALAEVQPSTPATRALTPALLALAARDLIRRGEFVWQIDVDATGDVRLLPAGSWDVRGRWERSSWRYRVDLFGPSGNVTRLLPADAVIHGQYSHDAARPWFGISPLGWATLTGKLHGAVEDALGDESATTRGFLLPVPTAAAPAADGDDDDTTDPNAQFRADLAVLRGGTRTIETTRGAYGDGAGAQPEHDFKPQRIGADPPEALVSLRSDSALAVLAAAGVPTEMMAGADATASREAWRRFLHGSVNPLGDLLAAELAVKLDVPDLRLSFDRLFASDLSGRARAFQSMVNGGLSTDKAAGLAGLLEAE